MLVRLEKPHERSILGGSPGLLGQRWFISGLLVSGEKTKKEHCCSSNGDADGF
jgi:hypothetical protein